MRGKPKLREPKLSASIMCANLMNLGADLRTLEEQGFHHLHLDIMDGHFVPEIGFGTFFLEQVARSQRLPVDVHLMVTDPARYIDPLVKAGASLISIHCESEGNVRQMLWKIRGHSRGTGLAVRPETPLVSIVPFLDLIDMVLLMAYAPGIRNQKAVPRFEQRIRELSQILETHGGNGTDIAVDGGVSESHMKRYGHCGANFFILGSSGLFIPNTRLAEQAERVLRVFHE